jgi:hypothetical protein
VPDAAEAAAEAGLSEFHLRHVVALPDELHAPVVRVAVAQGLSARDVAALVQDVRARGEAALRHARAALGVAQPPRQSARAWSPLLRALPEDWQARVALLERELSLLPARQRERRLAQLQEQQQRAEALAREYRRILDEHPETS